MALARMTFGWSLLAHGGVVAGLWWFGPGTASRPRLVPPLVQMEWRNTATVAAAMTPAEPAVAIEPVVSEPVADCEVSDEMQATAEPFAPDLDAHRRCAHPTFEELRRSLRRAAPPVDVTPAAPPPATAAAAPLSRVLTPIAGTTIPPRYPASARRRGQEGTVLLAVTVAAEGSVTEALVVRSSGHAVLDDEAVRTVQQWRFAGGPGVCEQAIEFRLRNVSGRAP